MARRRSLRARPTFGRRDAHDGERRIGRTCSATAPGCAGCGARSRSATSGERYASSAMRRRISRIRSAALAPSRAGCIAASLAAMRRVALFRSWLHASSCVEVSACRAADLSTASTARHVRVSAPLARRVAPRDVLSQPRSQKRSLHRRVPTVFLASPRSRTPHAGRQMATILYVDDEPAIGLILEDTLERAGHSAIGAHNGARGAAGAREAETST